MRRHRALALIVVVYVLAALGTFAFALAFRSKVGLCQAQLSIDQAQQDQLVLAACAQACRLLALDDPAVDSFDDAWSGWHSLESGDVAISGQAWWRLVDESGKINVNAVSADVLLRIEGLDPAVAASILDWIDKDDVPNPDGAESQYYAGQAGGYACKNAPLERLEELAFVKGITAELYYGTRSIEPLEDLNDLATEQVHATQDEEGSAPLADLLTVYGDGKINLNTASVDVLKTLPFLSQAAIDEIVSKQQPRAAKFAKAEDIQTNGVFSEMDKIILSQVGKFNSSYFGLQVKVQLGEMPSVCEYAAVLEREGTNVRVLSWQRRLPRASRFHDGAESAGQVVRSMD
jgi:general secretion pathway protein K